jgi:peptidoglycan/LPS O-acetylase OafA/YrhL
MAPPSKPPVNPHLRELSDSPIRPIHRKPLPALTGVRFFAAMQVVFFHYGAGFALRHRFSTPFYRLLDNGWTSVTLFFLLSGFILSYTYEGQIEGTQSRRHFWQARFARIYPVYFLSLVAMIPFAFSSGYLGAVHSVWQGLSVVAMVQAWNPFLPANAQIWNAPAWTLSVEAFFYLVFPFVLPPLEKASLRVLRISAVSLLLLIVFAHTMTPTGSSGTLFFIPLPVVRLPEFLLGAISGILFLRSNPPRYPVLIAIASLLGVAIIETTVQGPWISLLAIPFALLLYSLADGKGFVARILSSNMLVLLGGASYSIYLLQIPVRLWTHRFLSRAGAADSIDAVVSPILLVAISVLVFLAWEEPARRWIRNRFRASQKTRRSSSPAPVSPMNAP